MQIERPHYFPHLDASRFFAFLPIFIFHYVSLFDNRPEFEAVKEIKQLFRFAELGLDFFFVLSSFLITWIVLNEYHKYHKFSMPKFLVRRVLRVWPLYFSIVFIGFLMAYVAGAVGSPINPLPNFLYFLFFVVNFYIIENGNQFLFFLVFLWSISAEEQFYIIWALVMKYAFPYFKWIAAGFIVVSLVYRWFAIQNQWSHYDAHLLNILGHFGVGALGALWAFNQPKWFVRFAKSRKLVSGFAFGFIGFSAISFFAWSEHEGTLFFTKLLVAFSFLFYIYDQAFKPKPLIEPGKSKWLTYMGKISYGLYCYHGVVLTITSFALARLNLNVAPTVMLIVLPLVLLGVTAILAHLSYQYVELYFLKLKKKFSAF